MDTREALIIAQKYLDLISVKYKIKKALLFGSYARGKNNPDSDIDVAVVIEKSDDIIETQIEMMKLRRAVDLRIEPHPFLEEDFNISDPLASEIIKYGISLPIGN